MAAERGTYQSFAGSLWSQGILPIDSIELLAQSRDEGHLELDRSQRPELASLRKRVRQGMKEFQCHGYCADSDNSQYRGGQHVD